MSNLEQRAKLVGVIAASIVVVAVAAVVIASLLGNPRSTPAPTGEDGLTDEALCSHIIDVLTKRWAARGTQPSTEEAREHFTSCVIEMERNRRKLGNEQFTVHANCVMAASTLEDIAGCEPDS